MKPTKYLLGLLAAAVLSIGTAQAASVLKSYRMLILRTPTRSGQLPISRETMAT